MVYPIKYDYFNFENYTSHPPIHTHTHMRLHPHNTVPGWWINCSLRRWKISWLVTANMFTIVWITTIQSVDLCNACSILLVSLCKPTRNCQHMCRILTISIVPVGTRVMFTRTHMQTHTHAQSSPQSDVTFKRKEQKSAEPTRNSMTGSH